MRKFVKFLSGVLSAALAFNFAAPTVSKYIAASDNEIASMSEVIRAGFENYETSIDISRFELLPDDVTKLSEVINYVRTIPELFYVLADENITITPVWSDSKQTWILGALNVTYSNTREEAEPKINEFNAKVDEIISQTITDDMTDLQKALRLHDYIVLNTVYDTAGTLPDFNEGSSAYDVLVCGNGICQGYAQAYNVLLQEVGIESIMVVSYEMRHAWNLVNIDDEWYHVDVTWDDPVPDSVGRVNHKYFLLSDEEIQKTTEIRQYVHKNWDAKGFTATSSKYDNAFWSDVTTEFFFSGGNWYFVNGNGEYSTYVEAADEVNTNVSVCDEKWLVWGQYDAYWTGKYISLIISDGVVYYNSPTMVYRMNLDGSNKQAFSRYINPNETDGYVYGLRLVDSTLYAVIKQEPTDEGKLYEIMDIQFDAPVSFIDLLVDHINSMAEGDEKEYQMDTETILPAAAIKAMMGRDIRLSFVLDGYQWDIKGRDVNSEAEEVKDLNLEIKRDQGIIPDDMIDSISNPTSECVELNLSHNGEFGLAANINYNVGLELANKIAVLYYYNQAEATMDRLDFSMIDNEGNLNIGLRHASSYAVIIQDAKAPSDPIISEQEKPPQEPVFTTVSTIKAPEETTSVTSETTVTTTTTVPETTTVSETTSETTIESSIEIEPEVKKGDITLNGIIDVTDITYLSLTCLKEYTPSDLQLRAADVNEDGKVNLQDLARVKQYISNIISEL